MAITAMCRAVDNDTEYAVPIMTVSISFANSTYWLNCDKLNEQCIMKTVTSRKLHTAMEAMYIFALLCSDGVFHIVNIVNALKHSAQQLTAIPT